ncbi:hypothetical protein GCM10009557_13780 [Virgisporangium ochraceum]|uniref:DUF2637 domain-containing protein n=1 Tax=Virgisporangium ochraceum TaxID=65505 RepID=A0A8J3ZW65_9ACTN|nr:DUF2637 domain-containing protein [Virgisporangium ochraceum]GIJ71252.1 hypothetical protein Voc01_061690 [Virgisporangium ochraceum]
MTTERAEGLVQVIIMLAIGAMAGAASFTHVHDVTVAHGQPNWIGWANAVVVELMSIALGLELRRRARTHRPTAFVGTALLFFVAVSLAAQVVEAERSVIGWLAAALPAIGFLVLAKVVLSRTAAVTITATTSEPATADTTTSSLMPDRPVTTDLVHTADNRRPHDLRGEQLDELDGEQHAQADELVGEHITDATATEQDASAPLVPAAADTSPPAVVDLPAHLLPTARFSIVNHQQTTGRPITAPELATRMSIGLDTAGQLLHAVTGHTEQHEQPVRVNGTPIGGTR